MNAAGGAASTTPIRGPAIWATAPAAATAKARRNRAGLSAHPIRGPVLASAAESAAGGVLIRRVIAGNASKQRGPARGSGRVPGATAAPAHPRDHPGFAPGPARTPVCGPYTELAVGAAVAGGACGVHVGEGGVDAPQ
ncbi:hypothetical protein Aglo01_08580 [Actinokineospora globicatena]|nr:hypothetical protein Aglo01_08580 [Actinokineospora globicatena]GLW83211.1 hypothetical protein Aglo02_08510 [Actinokineospora globicatena]